MFDMFSRGAVERMAILAFNVMAPISASNFVQLLGAMHLVGVLLGALCQQRPGGG